MASLKRASLAILLLLAACTKPSEAPAPPPQAAKKAEPAAPITTDRARYTLQEGPYGPETTIVSTYTAPPERAVYLVNCNGASPMGLQRQVGNEWVLMWNIEMNACASAPIVIPPGGRHTGTFTAASGVDALVESRRTDTRLDPGTYRVIWHGLTASENPVAGKHDFLAVEERVSAPIIIDAAPPRDPSSTSPRVRPGKIASIEPAHASRVGGRAPVRVQFASAPFGHPILYVDGKYVETTTPRAKVFLEYIPPRNWAPGRHEVRVVYQDQQRATRWYAWFFIAGAAWIR